jgi:hypothetical protein
MGLVIYLCIYYMCDEDRHVDTDSQGQKNVCGNALFLEGPNMDLLVDREVTCQAPIETTYYSGRSIIWYLVLV